MSHSYTLSIVVMKGPDHKQFFNTISDSPVNPSQVRLLSIAFTLKNAIVDPDFQTLVCR